MLYAEERKRKITDYIQGNSRASVQELSQFFEVSESTVCRDLKELEEEKLLRRMHGGAIVLQNVNFEPAFNEKEDKFQEEKKAIQFCLMQEQQPSSLLRNCGLFQS
ncbi:DeoR family transcriptional regulator [Ectobacillus funiculus]|uniref:DeoR family transcriptional regulator n=1 Tax=Ectobacillus funiculus TaxID=137993 RepID=A0ABV5WG83_9BACI